MSTGPMTRGPAAPTAQRAVLVVSWDCYPNDRNPNPNPLTTPHSQRVPHLLVPIATHPQEFFYQVCITLVSLGDRLTCLMRDFKEYLEVQSTGLGVYRVCAGWGGVGVRP